MKITEMKTEIRWPETVGEDAAILTPEVRRGIEQASRLLKDEIGDLRPIEVTATWDFVKPSLASPMVEMELSGHGAGLNTKYLTRFSPADFLGDVARLRPRLRDITTDFLRRLSRD